RHRRSAEVGRGALRPPLRRSRSLERGRLGGADAAVGGDLALLRLAGRSPPAHAMARHCRLRDARQRVHRAPPRYSTRPARHLGPTLSLKGIDNAAYYRLVAGERRYYMDYTGTGNSLNMRHPHVLQLIMDSLRYWIEEMHVDGFRFDLAATLARGLHEVDRLSAFFDLIQQDPVVSRVKLIAEPWDVGDGGYQVGNFPPGW